MREFTEYCAIPHQFYRIKWPKLEEAVRIICGRNDFAFHDSLADCYAVLEILKIMGNDGDTYKGQRWSVTYSSDPVTKNKKNLNRKAAKYAKLKTRSRGIVQNRDTVLDKAAFSFAACPVKREACLTGVHPANEKKPSCLPLRPLRLE